MTVKMTRTEMDTTRHIPFVMLFRYRHFQTFTLGPKRASILINFHTSKCILPPPPIPGSKGGGDKLVWGVPIRTTGEKDYHTVYTPWAYSFIITTMSFTFNTLKIAIMLACISGIK
jgi:hypothetical protein